MHVPIFRFSSLGNMKTTFGNSTDTQARAPSAREFPVATTDPQGNVASAHPDRSVTEPGQAEPVAGRGASPNENLFRRKLNQLLRPRALLHPPALQFDEDWQVAARQVCLAWMACQEKHNPSTICHIALSRMKALDYERRHMSDIPADQRIFGGMNKREDFYQAQILAFLDAVGEENPVAVLDAFKRTGTGGLHRHPAIAVATVGNVLGAAQQLTPDLATKAVLSSVRLAVQITHFHQLVESGPRRMRNAQTENLMVPGRADAGPSAKKAPDLLSASIAVMRNLKRAEKTLARVETAFNELEALRRQHRAAGQSDPGIARALQEAKDRLELAFAKACHLTETKAAYKAASGTGKTEFFGNKRYFATSISSTSLTLTASLLSILTPVVLSAAVTGGISAAAVLMAAGVYLAYHFSDGASRDGEEKARRAIIALAKSLDILVEDGRESNRQRAAAYKDYREEVKSIWKNRSALLSKEDRLAAKAAKKALLLERLQAISRKDKDQPGIDARRNWELYRDHLRNREAGTADAAQQSAIDREFAKTLEGHMATKAVSAIWKKDIRIRMEAAHQLLVGKTAQAAERMLKAEKGAFMQRLVRIGGETKAARVERLKEDLKRNLVDLLNVELAMHRMQDALTDPHPSDELRRQALREAAEAGWPALAAIRDEDMKSLFCGDAEQQTDMAGKAMAHVVGQYDRYFWTNLGNATVNMAATTTVMAADTAIQIQKAEGLYSGPKFADYKFLQSQQPGPQGAAYQNSGARTTFKERETKKQLATLDGQGTSKPRLHIDLGISRDGRATYQATDADVARALDSGVERIRAEGIIPDTLRFFRHQEADRPPADQRPAEPAAPAVKLTETRSYWKKRFEDASFAERWAFRRRTLKTWGRQVEVSVAGPPAQAVAQRTLNKTRPAMRKLDELRPVVRQALREGEDRPQPSSLNSHRPQTDMPLPFRPTEAGQDSRPKQSRQAAVATADAGAPGRATESSDMVSAVLRAADRVAASADSRDLDDALLEEWGLGALVKRR